MDTWAGLQIAIGHGIIRCVRHENNQSVRLLINCKRDTHLLIKSECRHRSSHAGYSIGYRSRIVFHLSNTIIKMKLNTEGLPTPPPSSTEHEEIYIRHACDPDRRHGRCFIDHKDSVGSTCSSGSDVYTSASSSYESIASMQVEVSMAPHGIPSDYDQPVDTVPPPPLKQRPILPKAYRRPPPTTPSSRNNSNSDKTPLSLKAKFALHRRHTQSSATPLSAAQVGSSRSHSSRIIPLFASHLTSPWAALSKTRSRWSPDSSDDETQQPRARCSRRNGTMFRFSGAVGGLARRLSSASSHARSSREARSTRSSKVSNRSSHSQPPSRRQGGRRSG